MAETTVDDKGQVLRESKADLFVEARQATDLTIKDGILDKNPDLKILFSMMNDLKSEYLNNDEVDLDVKMLIVKAFEKNGVAERYTQHIAEAMRDGDLDDGQVDIDKKVIAFNKGKVLDESIDAMRHEYLFGSSLSSQKNQSNVDAHTNNNLLANAYPLPKSNCIANAIALDMANNAPEVQHANIVAQAPSITGAALFYTSQERNITTPSEQAALPHISDKLVAMVLDDDPAIVRLNERSQQVMNKMTHEINNENELG